MWEVGDNKKDEVITLISVMWNLAVMQQLRGHPCWKELLTHAVYMVYSLVCKTKPSLKP